MTPEAQRIAIGKACNWERLGEYAYRLPDGREFHVDLLNDLNAMHEAEKVLTANQHYGYTGRLERTVDGFCATSAHRAEAFLRTLGLWKD